MSEREPKFAYRLEALIRLRSAERDALKAPMQEAAREVERRSRECEEILRAIERGEAELRALLASGASIAVDEQLRVQAYLGAERARHAAKRRELAEAIERSTRLMSELAARSRDTRALELHRQRKRREFDEEAGRALLNAADAQWLARRTKETR
jgi:hypothetical protein